MTRSEAKKRLYQGYSETVGDVHRPLDHVLWHYKKFWSRVLPADKTLPILDLGCGSGRFLLFLKRAGFESLYGVDLSPDQVDAAHSLGLTQVSQGNALEYLAKYDSFFSVIVAQNVLEHLSLEELLTLLDAAHRALKKGGELWMVVPNAMSPLGLSVHHGDLTHEIFFTPPSLIQALTATGFGDIRISEVGTPVVHGVKSAVRFLLWKVIRRCLYLWRLVEFGELGPAAVFTHDMQAIARKGSGVSAKAPTMMDSLQESHR